MAIHSGSPRPPHVAQRLHVAQRHHCWFDHLPIEGDLAHFQFAALTNNLLWTVYEFLRENVSISLRKMLFLKIQFIKLTKVPFLSSLLTLLFMSGCWILSNTLSIEMIIRLFTSVFFHRVSFIDRLLDGEAIPNSWNEPITFMTYSLFYAIKLWIGFSVILLRIFTSRFMSEIGL